MTSSVSTVWLMALVPFVAVTIDITRRVIHNRIQRKGYPLPPGPTPLPVIGSVLSVNSEAPWLTYTEWQSKYGDIMHVQMLDSNVIILNSTTAAIDLLEKRSHIYSDRPFMATVKPFGHDCDFVFVGYNDHWRLCRRIFHQTFRAEASVNFRPMQLRRARQMIMNMIDSPDEYFLHFATFSSAIATSAVCDYEPMVQNDPMVTTIDNFLKASIASLMSEKTVLLKAFPFLLHIPDWLPGSKIKREARVAQEWRDKMVNMPYQHVQERLASKGHINDAMIPDHIARMEKLDDIHRSEYEMALKHASATAFIGSGETTTSMLMVFMLAMVENPHAWKRAQAEIDAVVGTDRLPEFDDRPALPYVQAILRETFRWQPIGPLGVPHATTRSDFYNGYYIPKGAMVMGNAWAMSRDEVRYPNAERFIPERFLDENGALTDDDPAEFSFGFGRRKCPGRHTADASVWIAVATMLATLDFNLAKDADGNDVTFTASFVNGIAYHPNPFPCRLTLRSHLSKDVLKRALGME